MTIPPDFGEVAERVRRSTVRVRDGVRGAGSGVIWERSGLIVTNAHVARGSAPAVELWDGRLLVARVLKRDLRRDLATLRVDSAGLPDAERGDSDRLRAGELVLAVGNPLGFIGALTMGVVHSLGAVGGLGREPWILADVRLAPGNSGGPLADARGRIIGINTMILHGLGVAIPSNRVVRFLEREEPRNSLGVVVRPIRVMQQGMGLLILEIAPGSPAGAASLLVGDLLLGVNGEPIRSLDDLPDALANSGGTVTLSFIRGGRGPERQVVARAAAWRAEAA